MEWIHLAQGTDQRLTLVNTVTNIWVLRIKRQVISLQPTVKLLTKDSAPCNLIAMFQLRRLLEGACQ